MKEDWEEQKKIEDSLKVCHEIQNFLKRETKEREYGKSVMNPGTRSEIDKILKNVISEEPAPKVQTESETKEPVSENVSEDTTISEDTTVSEDTTISEDTTVSEDKTVSSDTVEEYIERHPVMRTVLHVLICVSAALVLALLITRFVANHTSVEGSSMETTLANGDQLIVEKVSYYIHAPERFDVVVFPHGDNVNYIKRIIGLPGERVQIQDGYIYINGKLLDENYGREEIEDPGLATQEIQLGTDEYFVLGDNRNASIDSRKSEVGTIHRSDIKGKAWLRIYPLERASLVE